MSEFHVEIVKIGPIEVHPNADALEITRVHGGYPCCIRKGEFKEGDLAVYLPIDSVVPDTETWAFLKGNTRIKAKRLRGIFSMGLLAPMTVLDPLGREMPAGHLGEYWIPWKAGDNVQQELGIQKYEPQVHTRRQRAQSPFSGNEPDQPWMPRYTDIEGLRRRSEVLKEGEEVVLTEKIHGANGRWAFKDGRLWAGSHNFLRKLSPDCEWWEALYTTGLAETISSPSLSGLVFYGELFGDVQDLKYARAGKLDIVLFDIYDSVEGRYWDYTDFANFCDDRGIKRVPELYRGPWDPEICLPLCEGKTTYGGQHVREGFVVRPVTERWDDRTGRVIFKMIGEGYLLRKDA